MTQRGNYYLQNHKSRPCSVSETLSQMLSKGGPTSCDHGGVPGPVLSTVCMFADSRFHRCDKANSNTPTAVGGCHNSSLLLCTECQESDAHPSH